MPSVARGAVLSTFIGLALVEAAGRALPTGLPDLADLHQAWAVGSQPAFALRGDVLTTAPELESQGNAPVSFSPAKAPGTLRVFCVGDSTTAGWPVHPAGSFPRWLAAILADARPDLRFEVINAGFHGFDSERAVSVARELAAYSPDAFVFHAGYDDYHLYPLRSSRAFAVHSWLALHSGAYSLARRLAGRRPGSYALQPPVPRLTPSENAAVVEGFLGSLRSIEDAARSAGAAAILTDLPHSKTQAPSYPGWPAIEAMRLGQRELARRQAWTFAELPEVEDEARFVDHVHSDAQGYRLLALDVARALERSGKFPGRWKWDKLRSAAVMARSLGLDEPDFQARLHLRLAGYYVAKNMPEKCERELAAAPRSQEAVRLVDSEVRRAGSAALSGCLARARSHAR